MFCVAVAHAVGWGWDRACGLFMWPVDVHLSLAREACDYDFGSDATAEALPQDTEALYTDMSHRVAVVLVNVAQTPDTHLLFQGSGCDNTHSAASLTTPPQTPAGGPSQAQQTP